MIRIVGCEPGSKFYLLVSEALSRMDLPTTANATIVVVDGAPGTPSGEDFPSASSSDTYLVKLTDFDCSHQVFEKEEPPIEPHINGDLSYLYRRPKNHLRIPIRKNHYRVIHQPCWRAGRWKSLT